MDNRFKIFLSGGITGLSDEENSEWRSEIYSQVLVNYRNCTVVNPVTHFNPNNGTSEELEKEGMSFCLSHLMTSDAVIVNLNKTDSIGTAQELMLAHELHIPIIGFVKRSLLDKVHPWIKAEVIKIFTYNDEDKPPATECATYVLHHYLYT